MQFNLHSNFLNDIFMQFKQLVSLLVGGFDARAAVSHSISGRLLQQ
jgi:hypothetical protein